MPIFYEDRNLFRTKLFRSVIFTAGRYAREVCAVSVRPSVSLSVTRRSSTKTAKRRITQISPHNSAGLQFCDGKDISEIRMGSPQTGAKCRWWVD